MRSWPYEVLIRAAGAASIRRAVLGLRYPPGPRTAIRNMSMCLRYKLVIS